MEILEEINVSFSICSIFFSPQHYLREQPDNLTSINIVRDTMPIIGAIYSNLNRRNIQLAIHLFTTLNEFITVSAATFFTLPYISYKLIAMS